MAPPLHFELPLEIVGARVWLDSFGVREGTPPGNPLLLKITFFQWFFHLFFDGREPKRAPPGPPLDIALPSPGLLRDPPEITMAPLGPKKVPRAAERPF